MKGAGFGLGKAASSASLGNALILLIIGTSISFCYWFASFFGIACGLIGLINTPVLDLTIDFFAGAAREGAIFAKLDNLPDSVTRNVRNLARGALNYSSYIELTNAAAVFYINIILLGLIGYMSELTNTDFLNPEIILGIFLGGSTAYLLKWSTNS
jgi:Na+/H+-translocating membrane pyrophosphatase